MNEIDTLRDELLAALDAADDLKMLDAGPGRRAGQEGARHRRMKTLGGMDPEARKAMGRALNALKDEIAAAIEARKAALEDAELGTPAWPVSGSTFRCRRARRRWGRIHPISQTVEEVSAIFGDMGFFPSSKAPTSKPTGTTSPR